MYLDTRPGSTRHQIASAHSAYKETSCDILSDDTEVYSSIVALYVPTESEVPPKMPPTAQDCDCGFIDSKDPTKSTFTTLLIFNFTTATTRQLNDVFITASYNVSKSAYVRSYTPNNVQLSPSGLHLTCSPSTNNLTVPSAGLFTRLQTFSYGSYRAQYIVDSTVPGTVAGFFHYKNDTSEIDIEYLSARSPATLQYSVKPQQYLPNGAASRLTYQPDTFNNTAGKFSDWQFVWKKDAVYYGHDGNYSTKITTNVPQAAGRIFLNHWSDGNPKFSGGPPKRNSTVTVRFLQAVYNDTEAVGGVECVRMKEACVVRDGGVLEVVHQGDGIGGCCVLVVLLFYFWSRFG
jgi:hypothetical protein